MCNHYFIYETPNGSMSKGVCKYCGLKTKGRNSLPDKDYARGWHYKAPIERSRENRVEAILSEKAKGEYVF